MTIYTPKHEPDPITISFNQREIDIITQVLSDAVDDFGKYDVYHRAEMRELADWFIALRKKIPF